MSKYLYSLDEIWAELVNHNFGGTIVIRKGKNFNPKYYAARGAFSVFSVGDKFVGWLPLRGHHMLCALDAQGKLTQKFFSPQSSIRQWELIKLQHIGDWLKLE